MWSYKWYVEMKHDFPTLVRNCSSNHTKYPRSVVVYHPIYLTGINILEFRADTRTRGHSLKLSKRRSNKHLSLHFFSERVVNRWNKLPASVLNVTSINAFKAQLQKLQSTEIGFLWTPAVSEEPHGHPRSSSLASCQSSHWIQHCITDIQDSHHSSATLPPWATSTTSTLTTTEVC